MLPSSCRVFHCSSQRHRPRTDRPAPSITCAAREDWGTQFRGRWECASWKRTLSCISTPFIFSTCTGVFKMMNRDNPVWFITGCSTGFGRELAKLVLARGWRAVVTARDASKVVDIAAGHDDRALILPLDVTRRAQIDEVVAQAKQRFGRIDALVNNAGYGYLDAIEAGEA